MYTYKKKEVFLEIEGRQTHSTISVCELSAADPGGPALLSIHLHPAGEAGLGSHSNQSSFIPPSIDDQIPPLLSDRVQRVPDDYLLLLPPMVELRKDSRVEDQPSKRSIRATRPSVRPRCVWRSLTRCSTSVDSLWESQLSTCFRTALSTARQRLMKPPTRMKCLILTSVTAWLYFHQHRFSLFSKSNPDFFTAVFFCVRSSRCSLKLKAVSSSGCSESSLPKLLFTEGRAAEQGQTRPPPAWAFKINVRSLFTPAAA